MHERRQRRERIGGVTLAILGVAVLVIAVVALTAQDSGKKGDSATSQSSALASPTTSASASATSPSGTSSGSSSGTSSSSDSPSSSDTSSSDTSSSGDSKQRFPLVVLNNTTVNGLGAQAADDFRNGGWKIDRVGNLTNDIVSTCAYYDPDVDGAKTAAKALRKQFSGIKRVEPRFTNLPSAPIVVVLTPGFSSN